VGPVGDFLEKGFLYFFGGKKWQKNALEV